MLSNVCNTCSATPAKLLRCSACHGAWYCNAECQRSGWKSHKADCQRLKAEKMRANIEAGAAELQANDAMRVLVQTDRVVITRCADPDDSVFMQVAAQEGINGWLVANNVKCWCTDVGTCGPADAVFVVAAFAPSQLHALKQPRTELELSDYTRERGHLASPPITAFGLRLRITAEPVLGQLSVGLKEVPPDPAAPLACVHGTTVRSTCFFLSSSPSSSGSKGGDGSTGGGGSQEGAGGSDVSTAVDRLVLPPPMSTGTFAGQPRSNCEMKVWCGVGESVSSIVCTDAAALPHVPVTALQAAPYKAATAPTAITDSAPGVVAIGMLLERGSQTSDVAEFEYQTIRAFLHSSHAEQQPEASVPGFARALVQEANAVARMQEFVGGGSLRVEWMSPG